MKKESFVRLPPNADSLRQHCLRANYLAYLVRHHNLKQHLSPSDIDGSYSMVVVALSATHNLLSRCNFLQPKSKTDDSDDEDEEEYNEDTEVRLESSSECVDWSSSEEECSDVQDINI